MEIANVTCTFFDESHGSICQWVAPVNVKIFPFFFPIQTGVLLPCYNYGRKLLTCGYQSESDTIKRLEYRFLSDGEVCRSKGERAIRLGDISILEHVEKSFWSRGKKMYVRIRKLWWAFSGKYSVEVAHFARRCSTRKMRYWRAIESHASMIDVGP